MTASPPGGALLAGLLGDAEIGALFAPPAEIAAMVRVERALARAQGRLGLIPAPEAAAIDRSLATAAPDPAALAAGAARDGVVVPALVAALRAVLPAPAADWLHHGATSQDIVDTALALRLDAALGILSGRVDALIGALEAAALRWADLPMAGRTRGRVAAPITFGLRAAQWAHPLIDLRAALPGVRAGAARVQFGGAVGARAMVAPHGAALAAALAAELGLAPCPPWHANRAGPIAAAGWCAQVAGGAAKMAGDLILMGRDEAAEAQAGAGGASSAMPHKANPVAAEATVALARWAACLTAPMQLAAQHAEERDGAAWALEWLALPQIVVAAAACLRHALGLAETLAPHPARMAAGLQAGGGAAMAEAATHALAARLPRAQALAVVRAALAEVARGGTLAQALARLGPPGIDWDAVLDPAAQAPAAAAVARAVLDRGGQVPR